MHVYNEGESTLEVPFFKLIHVLLLLVTLYYVGNVAKLRECVNTARGIRDFLM